MTRYKTCLGFIVTAAACLVGCASVRERQAFEQIAATHGATRLAGEKAVSREDLPPLDANATLADYLLYAALNNPGVQAAFHRWKAALEKVPQARALPDPQFTYGYFIREVEMQQKVALAQMFPWYGKLKLGADVALDEAEIERHRFEAALNNLRFEVKDAYYEYYYLGRAIGVTEENMDLVRQLEAVVRAKLPVAAAGHPDIIKAQVELGKLEDELLTLRDFRGPVVARFNAGLNRPADAPLPAASTIPIQKADWADGRLETRLKESNPELKGLEATVTRERTAIRLARQDFYPDLMAGLEFETERAGIPGAGDSDMDPVMAMLSVNVPVWWAKYRAAVREAEARCEAGQKERLNKENELVSRLAMVLYKCRDAERKITLYRDTLLPLAEESLNVAQRGFASGNTDFLDMIDAERVLLEFRLSHERAVVDRAQRLAELEMLIGQPL